MVRLACGEIRQREDYLNTPFHIPTHSDEIDQFVEALEAHPERAEELKNSLRRRLAGRGVTRTPARAVPVDPEDPEEFWDNVPI